MTEGLLLHLAGFAVSASWAERDTERSRLQQEPLSFIKEVSFVFSHGRGGDRYD